VDDKRISKTSNDMAPPPTATPAVATPAAATLAVGTPAAATPTGNPAPITATTQTTEAQEPRRT